MRKKVLTLLLVAMMALPLFALPIAAATTAEVSVVSIQPEAVDTADTLIAPFGTEYTQIYWRTYRGVLQFRVWGLTSGRWLTDWLPVNP